MNDLECAKICYLSDHKISFNFLCLLISIKSKGIACNEHLMRGKKMDGKGNKEIRQFFIVFIMFWVINRIFFCFRLNGYLINNLSI